MSSPQDEVEQGRAFAAECRRRAEALRARLESARRERARSTARYGWSAFLAEHPELDELQELGTDA